MNDCRPLPPGEHEILESTIQHLYGLALKLEVGLQEPGQAGHQDRLDSVIDSIGDLIGSLRGRIEAIEARIREAE
jgi:hypothetical protein